MKETRPKLIIMLVAFLLSLNLWAQDEPYLGSVKKATQIAQTKTGDVIYNQMNNISTGGIVSADFSNVADTTFSSIAADDFVVPAGETWDIQFVKVPGFYQYYNDPNPIAESVNVYIFESHNDMPGDAIYSFEGITTFNEYMTDFSMKTNLFEITLPSTITLTEGSYWIGFTAEVDGSIDGYWYWSQEQAATTIENEFHWKNPEDGFGSGFTSWTTASMVMWFPPFDLAYGLFGEAFDNDLGIIALSEPISDTATTAENVTITVKNEGNNPQTDIEVNYQVNGGSLVTETITGITLGLNEYHEYTFSTPIDMTAVGPYEVVASVVLSGDQNPENNSMATTAYNLGEIYVMDSIHQDITTCGATFVDNGGLLGNFNDDDYGTMTIYPANPGSKVRLTFLEWDVTWSDFMIYDGTDVNAPLLGSWNQGTGSPGVVTAFDTANTDGALTIYFEGPGWANGAGWVAYISCYDPPADDFAVNELFRDVSVPALFENQPVTLYAVVQNFGTTEQSKDVTFTANGNVLGVVTSNVLPSTGVDTVELVWTPTIAGDYTIVASVPADMGEDDNNNQSESYTVYPEGSFFESFEGTEWVPEFWQATAWEQKENAGAFDGGKYAQIYVPFDHPEGDTLITPQLHIEAGDELSFAAMGSMWWPGALGVYYKDSQTGQWTLLEEITVNQMQWEIHTIDLTAAAGNNFIGFHGWFNDPYSWGGQTSLDFVIGNGVEIYYPEYDVFAKNITGPKVFNANDTVAYEITVKNTGELDLDSAAFNIVLKTDYAVLGSVAGDAITHLESQTYSIETSFDVPQNTAVYAEIDFPADMRPENNISNIYEIYIKPEGTVQENIGDGTDVTWLYPMKTSGGYMISEIMFYNEEIAEQGIINGVSLYFENTGLTDVEDFPLQLWLTQDPDTSVAGNWTQAANMSLVFDGTINLPRGGYEVHIPFDNNFIYTDDNLVMLMNSGTSEYSGLVNFYYTASTDVRTRYASDWNNPIDPNNVTQYTSEAMEYPNVKFTYIPGQFASLSGIVYNEFNNPLEDATVSVEGTSLVQETAFNGLYDFEYVPAGDLVVTATKFGYNDLVQNINLDNGVDTTMDFYMTLKPTVTVNGVVVGDDDKFTGLPYVDVTLEGYESYQMTANYVGEYAFNNVYGGSEAYVLTLSHPNYEVYVDTIVVEDASIDLDTITLNEIMKVAYNMEVDDNPSIATITWNHPQSGTKTTWALDDGYVDNGFAGEPTETVWLGNKFPVTNPVTITSFDLNWKAYENGVPTDVTFELFDLEGNSIWESEEFTTGTDEWITIDIPTMTFNEEFYAMVKWDMEPQSTYLAVDVYSGANYAYYYYEGGPFNLLADLIGYETMVFHVRANIIEENKGASDKAKVVTGYNIYRGELSDINNVANWNSLNTSPIVEHTYTDNSWPPANADSYTYAVEAIYSNGTSDYSLSYPITLTIDEPTNVILDASFAHIGNAILAWDAPQNQYVESYNLYLDDMTTSFDNITDLYYNYSELEAGDHEVGVSAVYPYGESEIVTSNILITVSVDEVNGENITMYPNPVISSVTIAQANNCKIEIYNVLGTLVSEELITSNVHKVNVANFESGMYFVKIYDDEGSIIKNVSIIKK